ncbi:hypothetical protein [Streptomyces akebiae]|uniref:Uncharacterized protein n=1 Tax=Streptomyces akebiae TaxID=2865673 RepID=A0ABX8XMW3_9ACTN|nr:hypothetical protein [Streptomyces akebiae]QYX76964.1 hypothetical protein K1J60_10960 [Streptomyces akebiae]
MPYAEEDSRKVQTAVVGRAESDWPVFLPYDPDDFDRFMRSRRRDDFKKGRFSHRPPVNCRRTETSEDSNDHLYIGRAVADWLKQQGQQGQQGQQAVRPVYKPKGHQVRDAVAAVQRIGMYYP